MSSNYDQIRYTNIREYGEGTRHLSFLKRLYTDRTHFIFELLQNAEDARATKIKFQLSEGGLDVKHDGRLFSEKDVRGVCGVGEGTKAGNLTQIGKFGIGFKSVYAYTSAPEVHSGDEHFRIESYVRPYSTKSREIDTSWTTMFWFPFNLPEIGAETACQEIAERLRKLSVRTLLFLRNIKEINYELLDGTCGVYVCEEKPHEFGRQVLAMGQNDIKDEQEDWLIFEKVVDFQSNDCASKIEVAFRLDSKQTDGCEQITRVADASLVVYFPTEKQTRFGFLVQGPYRTTPARDNIPKDDDWNKALVDQTASMLVDVLIALKSMRLLTVSLLDSMPIRMDDFHEDSMFFPIARSVCDAFQKHKLLPSHDQSFVSAKNAKLARGGELRELLSHEQLRALFQTKNELKWLTGKITQDRTPDLRAYLLNELGIEEITREEFAKKLSEQFLVSQSDNWVVRMYRYAEKRETLWRKSIGNMNPTLCSKPIIRLQDGSHVAPFRKDGSPNAYISDGSYSDSSLPIVKLNLSNHEESRRFLKGLGIPELDLVAEVIEVIIPKYKHNPSQISLDEHQCHIDTIEKAYKTDSHDKKLRLQKLLCETPFIRVDNKGHHRIVYKEPNALYFGNDEIHSYFAENNNINFVCTEYNEPVQNMLEDLGVAKLVRVRRKKPNHEGHVVICNEYGMHLRGLNKFDPDIEIDGLDVALESLTPKKIEFIWNNIAVPNSSCIRGVVESSTRKTYDNSKKKCKISNFGKLLTEKKWLPSSDGDWKKPSELSLDDLPNSFSRNENLARKLGMQSNYVSELAREAGVDVEDIKLLKSHPNEFLRWKEKIFNASLTPEFPESTSKNPELRRERVAENYSNSPNKEYDKSVQSGRTTGGREKARQQLITLYTNKAEQMICQICKDEMPFKKRNMEYYFEAVEAFDRELFQKEHEAQYLALCPLCAAKYKEFVKLELDVMVKLRNSFKCSSASGVSLELGSQKTTIQFVETHFQDIVTIIEEEDWRYLK